MPIDILPPGTVATSIHGRGRSGRHGGFAESPCLCRSGNGAACRGHCPIGPRRRGRRASAAGACDRRAARRFAATDRRDALARTGNGRRCITRTGISSARLYRESKLNFLEPKHVAIPVAVSVFADEIYAAPKRWVQNAYPRLIHYNRLPKGGHFAPWEQPQALSGAQRASFHALR